MGGRPAPWQAPAANGTALEGARAASVASKTCEEGRGCRQSLSGCSALRATGTTATSGQHVLCPFQPRPRLRPVGRGQEQGRAAGPPLAWPTPPARPEARSWGPLDALLPVPCDLEPEREEGQVYHRGCLPPPLEHPRARSCCWGRGGGAPTVKTPLHENPL